MKRVSAMLVGVSVVVGSFAYAQKPTPVKPDLKKVDTTINITEALSSLQTGVKESQELCGSSAVVGEGKWTPTFKCLGTKKDNGECQGVVEKCQQLKVSCKDSSGNAKDVVGEPTSCIELKDAKELKGVKF